MKEYQRIPIKDWSVEDRPREKFVRSGVKSLSNAELIAILLGSGTRKSSALDISRELLANTKNSLDLLSKSSFTELMRTPGIGEAKAITLVAAFELGNRKKNERPANDIFIKNSQSAYEVLNERMGELEHEEFWIIILNRAHKVIDTIKISQGGLTGTVIDTRMILKHALDRKATSIIIAHNHPSGNKNPSEADRNITIKIKKAAALMDITLLDHIILAGNSYLSFADEGILP